jgi:hypothetical protein
MDTENCGEWSEAQISTATRSESTKRLPLLARGELKGILCYWKDLLCLLFKKHMRGNRQCVGHWRAERGAVWQGTSYTVAPTGLAYKLVAAMAGFDIQECYMKL